MSSKQTFEYDYYLKTDKLDALFQASQIRKLERKLRGTVEESAASKQQVSEDIIIIIIGCCLEQLKIRTVDRLVCKMKLYVQFLRKMHQKGD